jgi:hypothetical protein
MQHTWARHATSTTVKSARQKGDLDPEERITFTHTLKNYCDVVGWIDLAQDRDR